MQRADCEAHKQAAHLRLADRDVAGRQVEQDLGPGQCGRRARRLRHPQILADLDVKGEARRAAGGEQQVAAERRLAPGERDRPAGDAFARGEMPALVEFAVIRQKDLRDDPEQLPAMDHRPRNCRDARRAQRRADGKDRETVAARADQPVELRSRPRRAPHPETADRRSHRPTGTVRGTPSARPGRRRRRRAAPRPPRRCALGSATATCGTQAPTRTN